MGSHNSFLDPDKRLISLEWTDTSDPKNLYTVVSADTVHTIFTSDFWLGVNHYAKGIFMPTDREMYDVLAHNINHLDIMGYITMPALEIQMKMALANVLNNDFTLAGKSQVVQRAIRAYIGEVPQLNF